MIVPPVTWPALPISCLGNAAVDTVQASRTSKSVSLAIRLQAAGTVGCDHHRLRAGPRRLTLGLQRLHCGVLCGTSQAVGFELWPWLARKQRATSFLIWPCERPGFFGHMTSSSCFPPRVLLSGEAPATANHKKKNYRPFPHFILL